jgi:hypothetical protein
MTSQWRPISIRHVSLRRNCARVPPRQRYWIAQQTLVVVILCNFCAQVEEPDDLEGFQALSAEEKADVKLLIDDFNAAFVLVLHGSTRSCPPQVWKRPGQAEEEGKAAQ